MKIAWKFAFVSILLSFLLLITACAENVEKGKKDSNMDIEKQTSKTEIYESAPETSADEHTVTADNTSTVPQTTSAPDTPSGTDGNILNYRDIKAIWLSQFDMANVYKSGGKQRNVKSYTDMVTKILGNIKNLGFNTVIVQVRPYADSMYPSEYYPMSDMVVGAFGNREQYDPFAIIVDKARKLGLSVHAWINPMRGMDKDDLPRVSEKYLIRQWYDDKSLNGRYIVLKNGRWFLNVAYEPVRQLIIDGAREILEKYNVDGLHMDDYFYPTTDTSFDAYAYAGYIKSGGKMTVANWRREQLNLLVSGLWQTVKEHDRNILFGISPAGNYNTVYEKQFADIYRWCAEEGYIDYICPQVYFGLEHGSYDFVKVSEKYQSMIKTDKVRLIIGMSLGKAVNGSKGVTDKYAGSGQREWIVHRDVLRRCLEKTNSFPKCTGVAYFCYQYFYDPVTGAQNPAGTEERRNFLPLLKEISWQ